MGKISQSHGEATERLPVRLTHALEEDGPGEEGNLKRQQLGFSKLKKAVSPGMELALRVLSRMGVNKPTPSRVTGKPQGFGEEGPHHQPPGDLPRGTTSVTTGARRQRRGVPST